MPREYANILVAVDGSATSELAFKKAVNIVLRNEGKLYIAHIIDTRSLHQFYPAVDRPITMNTTQFLDTQSSAAEETLEKFIQWANGKGVTDIEIILKHGSPRTELADVIPDEHPIDLLILGATGLNAIERAFVGSVSQYVVRNAPCDVLVVRTDSELSDGTPIVE